VPADIAAGAGASGAGGVSESSARPLCPKIAATPPATAHQIHFRKRNTGGHLAPDSRNNQPRCNQFRLAEARRARQSRARPVPLLQSMTSLSPILIVLGVLLLLVVILALWVVGIYNTLVALRNRFKNAFAQIDVQLKRRYDLIPNLVETAKGYLKHERETLEAVIKARNIAAAAAQAVAANPANASAMKSLVTAETGLTGALSRLMVVSEQYPDLKANQNMMQLTEELTSTENKIAFARQAYNDAVMTYNTSREVFPNVIFAGMFGFLPAELFKIEDPTERTAPKVSFT
jgi:LemA protein